MGVCRGDAVVEGVWLEWWPFEDGTPLIEDGPESSPDKLPLTEACGWIGDTLNDGKDVADSDKGLLFDDAGVPALGGGIAELV